MPIYTLRVFSGRIYIVNDSRLASAIQRRSDVFSFDPFVLLTTERLAGTTKEGMKLVRQDITGGHHERGVVNDYQERTHKFLSSSSSLESMSYEMFRNITVVLQELGHNDGSVVNLSSWVKQAISITSTNTMYGPMNPFATNSKMYSAFW